MPDYYLIPVVVLTFIFYAIIEKWLFNSYDIQLGYYLRNAVSGLIILAIFAVFAWVLKPWAATLSMWFQYISSMWFQ
jgi:hypothetical protein